MPARHEDYDEDDYDTPGQESNLVKDLRKQLREATKERDALQEQVTTLSKVTRTSSLKEVLESKKLNPKLAVFYPADGEVTPEAVDAWAKEYADVFGIQTQEEAPAEPAIDAEQAQLYGRMVAEQGVPGTAKLADLAAQIQNAKSAEELEAILRSN